MAFVLHPEFSLQKLRFGNENAPLIVIDNLLADADQLVRAAAEKKFIGGWRFYPGIRAKVSLEYQRFVIDTLKDTLIDYFELDARSLHFSMCHYSLVTQPADKLVLLQRLPHFDSLESNGLAAIHYLFKKDLGGTAFYRHRATGFEYVDDARSDEYMSTVMKQSEEPGFPGCNYINGDTDYYEQIAAQDGVFNRMLIYRRNSLHSGRIAEDFVPDSNPSTGRLSVNFFIDISN